MNVNGKRFFRYVSRLEFNSEISTCTLRQIKSLAFFNYESFQTMPLDHILKHDDRNIEIDIADIFQFEYSLAFEYPIFIISRS